MTVPDIAILVERAQTAGKVVEERRQATLSAAFRRQEAILSLKAIGLSVRKIADQLQVSPSVAQAQLQNAAARRPKSTRRDERIPYELHVLVFLRLEENPQEIKALALKNLDRMESKSRAPIARSWLRDWRSLINGPIDELRKAMLADTEVARELRQLSPFAGAISQDERLDAIRKAAV